MFLLVFWLCFLCNLGIGILLFLSFGHGSWLMLCVLVNVVSLV